MPIAQPPRDPETSLSFEKMGVSRADNDFLRLPHLRTLEVGDHGDHYEVLAEGLVDPTACPACGNGLHGHGSQDQEYLDTPAHGKQVLIRIRRRRFRCKGCGKTLFEPLPAIDGKRLATARLIAYVEQRCLQKSFLELSREVGVDDKTVRHIFDDYIARMTKEVVFEVPEVLGIDELKIIGQYRAVITNIEQLALYDLLPSRKKADLLRYFKRMPERERVRVLTMDLWSVYRQVAHAAFPGRLIVADRWHVVRIANDSVEKVRKQVRKTLDTRTRLKLKDDRFILLTRYDNLTDEQRELLAYWQDQFPELVAAYHLKERFHDLYFGDGRTHAERLGRQWCDEIPESLAWAFREAKGALLSWWDEIFNYYEYPISNAYTESVNRLAKDMNRMGRGYSFEVIRARLVYDEKARRKTRNSIRGRARAGDLDTTTAIQFVRLAETKPSETQGNYVEYGPHIPTLCDLLEAGHFEQ